MDAERSFLLKASSWQPCTDMAWGSWHLALSIPGHKLGKRVTSPLGPRAMLAVLLGTLAIPTLHCAPRWTWQNAGKLHMAWRRNEDSSVPKERAACNRVFSPYLLHRFRKCFSKISSYPYWIDWWFGPHFIHGAVIKKTKSHEFHLGSDTF